MKKENAIRYYRKFSGADAYILGFVYKHDLYCITVDEIMPRFMRVEKSSSKKVDAKNFSLDLTTHSKNNSFARVLKKLAQTQTFLKSQEIRVFLLKEWFTE